MTFIEDEAGWIHQLDLSWMDPLIKGDKSAEVGASASLETLNVWAEFHSLFQRQDNSRPVSLWRLAWISHKWHLVVSGLLFLLQAVSQILVPLVFKGFLEYCVWISDQRDGGTPASTLSHSRGIETSLQLLALLVVGQAARTFAVQILTRRLSQFRTALAGAIFRRTLTLPLTDRSTSSPMLQGRIVSMYTSDLEKLLEYVSGVHLVWVAPLLIYAAFHVMYSQVGEATLAGVAAMIVLTPLSIYPSMRMAQEQRKTVEYEDQRASLLASYLEGIRSLKVYGWESTFRTFVEQIRGQQVDAVRSNSRWRSLSFIIFTFVPYFAGLFVFLVAAFQQVDLSIPVAFCVIALLQAVRFPLTFLPLAVSYWVQLALSFKRIQSFLFEGAFVEPRNETSPSAQGYVVELENCNFFWSSDTSSQPALSSLNLKVSKGDVVQIAGPTASGKSTLLLGLLSELNTNPWSSLEYKKHVCGRICFVPQEPVIYKGVSIRDNIIDGEALNQVCLVITTSIEPCALNHQLGPVSASCHCLSSRP